MEFRVTQQDAMNAAVRQAQARQQQIANLQNQLATGLRVMKPSDDPTVWGNLSSTKSSVSRMDTNLENIATARQRLNQSVSTLTEAGNLLVRAREIALSGHQSQDHEILALEVDRLVDGMMSIANSAESGLHLYSGTASHRAPFEVTDVDERGRPLGVQYHGSDDASEVLVGRGTTTKMLPSGSQVFQQGQRRKSIYIGSTGAAAGNGTDNATGIGTLTVKHSSTSYASGNVVPGASSLGGDTIVGAAGTHVLAIDDDPVLGRVVRLNDGGPVAFDNTSTNLEVAGAAGEKVYVDLSSVPPNFSGSVEITANGTLSVDGGQTEVPIDFSTNQVVTHGQTASVTVVDASRVRRSGTDRIEYSGTSGVFASLLQLRDDLRSTEQWSTPEFVSIMDARIADVERAHNQIMEFVGEQAVELANMETLENRTREVRLMTQEAVIEIENADIADVIVRLQTEQNHLQFIYAATASMSQTSLLDFI